MARGQFYGLTGQRRLTQAPEIGPMGRAAALMGRIRQPETDFSQTQARNQELLQEQQALTASQQAGYQQILNELQTQEDAQARFGEAGQRYGEIRGNIDRITNIQNILEAGGGIKPPIPGGPHTGYAPQGYDPYSNPKPEYPGLFNERGEFSEEAFPQYAASINPTYAAAFKEYQQMGPIDWASLTTSGFESEYGFPIAKGAELDLTGGKKRWEQALRPPRRFGSGGTAAPGGGGFGGAGFGGVGSGLA